MHYRTPIPKKLITVRDTRKSRKLEMGRYLTKIDWSLVCGPLVSGQVFMN